MALINCVVYENGERTASVTLGAVAPYLTRPGCLVWAALHDPTEDELETAEKMFGLHELAVEDVRRQHQRPKVEDYANFLFVVMHTVEFANELTVGELDVFVGGNFVLSVRTGAERSFADVRERVERSPHLLRLGPGFVLYALMDAVVDRYFPVLDHIETDIETVEAQIFSENIPRSSIQELYAVKQELGVLRHATSPLLEAVTQITSNRGMTLDASLRDYFRDIYDHLARIDQAVDSDRDTVMTAIAASLTSFQLQDNQTTKRLASYGALIAVPTLIAGVYGMNFDHVPEFNWLLGYPFALGLMAAVDVYLFFRFRQVHWL